VSKLRVSFEYQFAGPSGFW